MDVADELHKINGKLNELVTDVLLIKQSDEFNKKDKEDLTEIVKDLVISVNRLTLTIEKSEGVSEGKITIMKVVWTSLSIIILGWCTWVSKNIMENNGNIKVINKEMPCTKT